MTFYRQQVVSISHEKAHLLFLLHKHVEAHHPIKTKGTWVIKLRFSSRRCSCELKAVNRKSTQRALNSFFLMVNSLTPNKTI